MVTSRYGRTLAVALAAALAWPVLAPVPAAAAGPQPIDLTVSGPAGAGTSLRPGIPCAKGGTGASWHYDYAAPIPAGAFSATQPGELRLHLDLHAEPATTTPVPTYERGFLAGESSEVVLANPRGSVRLALKSGSGTCADRPVTFDGTRASGQGTWRVVGASGAYRDVVASGARTFTLTRADVAPGADNPFAIRVQGAFDVLDPGLTIAAVDSYWGNFGLDYLNRVVTVVYRITNPGPGDAFGARLTKVESLSQGVSVAAGTPLELGDLAAGESVELRFRHKLGLIGPCALVILGCQFATRFTTSLPDALDVASTAIASAAATAPILPLVP